MNFAVLLSPPASRHQNADYTEQGEIQITRNLTLKMLEARAHRQGLPLDIEITSTSIEDDHVVYHCAMQSKTTQRKWVVSYRYSEIHAFKNQVQELLTCHSPKCSGSCQAIRDYLSACFPRKRLVLSSSARSIAERKEKLETVLRHLLRCVLLPGSAMKCLTARRALPTSLFEFLGVADEQDRRSLLQIFVDNHQKKSGVKRSASNTSLASLAEETVESPSMHSSTSTWSFEDDSTCVICMDALEKDEEEEDDCCDTASESESTTSGYVSSVASSCCGGHKGDDEGSAVVLPCSHVFHRECIFEWLLFEFHCPLCRSRVGPHAVTNYCRPKSRSQWWLGEFDEDPLATHTA